MIFICLVEDYQALLAIYDLMQKQERSAIISERVGGLAKARKQARLEHMMLLEQVKEELEQRSIRRRTRRTVEEIPQVTNEDMHGKETNEESTVVRQDNGAEEIPSNTNDVSNIPTNDESTEDDCIDYDDLEFDINPDEAGDSFEVEAGILW